MPSMAPSARKLVTAPAGVPAKKSGPLMAVEAPPASRQVEVVQTST
jgi:hypothetical protein